MDKYLAAFLALIALYIGARLVFYAWFETKRTFDEKEEKDD